MTNLAGLFRALFFIALAVSILWSIFISSISFTPQDVKEFGLIFSIVMALLFILPVVLVALLLRWLAMRFDQPATPPETAVESG